ncbi:MAG: type II secretion system F family protein [Thermoguttaceae bacterium]|nr:type II secretion system F family protein [Thermoguttaceae bacterium]MDW8038630.1 type II secretion system F family protein [Thermoguttaceae bacterium]
MTITLVSVLVAAAVGSLLLAVVLLVQDLRVREVAPDSEQALQQQIQEVLQARAAANQPVNRLDQWFYELIDHAGSPVDPQTATALVAGGAVVGCAAPLLLLESLFWAAVGTVVGALAPVLWWLIRRERRLRAMQHVMPETLEMIADAIRAGETLEQATELAGQQAPSPLKEEFAYAAKQLQLGQTPMLVMSRMARRIPLPEFKIFATAVMVHRQTGGNLALLAERLAHSARDRAEFAGHLRAVTAGSRLSIIGIVLGVLAALFILGGIRPEYLRAFLEHPLGPRILLLSAAFQVVGLLWVWRIMKVPY